MLRLSVPGNAFPIEGLDYNYASLPETIIKVMSPQTFQKLLATHKDGIFVTLQVSRAASELIQIYANSLNQEFQLIVQQLKETQQALQTLMDAEEASEGHQEAKERQLEDLRVRMEALEKQKDELQDEIQSLKTQSADFVQKSVQSMEKYNAGANHIHQLFQTNLNLLIVAMSGVNTSSIQQGIQQQIAAQQSNTQSPNSVNQQHIKILNAISQFVSQPQSVPGQPNLQNFSLQNNWVQWKQSQQGTTPSPQLQQAQNNLFTHGETLFLQSVQQASSQTMMTSEIIQGFSQMLLRRPDGPLMTELQLRQCVKETIAKPIADQMLGRELSETPGMFFATTPEYDGFNFSPLMKPEAFAKLYPQYFPRKSSNDKEVDTQSDDFKRLNEAYEIMQNDGGKDTFSMHRYQELMQFYHDRLVNDITKKVMKSCAPEITPILQQQSQNVQKVGKSLINEAYQAADQLLGTANTLSQKTKNLANDTQNLEKNIKVTSSTPQPAAVTPPLKIGK